MTRITQPPEDNFLSVLGNASEPQNGQQNAKAHSPSIREMRIIVQVEHREYVLSARFFRSFVRNQQDPNSVGSPVRRRRSEQTGNGRVICRAGRRRDYRQSRRTLRKNCLGYSNQSNDLRVREACTTTIRSNLT
jgi:hypothetical protein